MKALVLETYTDCENKWKSLEAAGYDIVIEQYDNRPHDRHTELVEKAIIEKPDFIVFIGAVEEYHHRPVPKPDIFKRLREIAPTIHMCNDAADPPWWPMLELYHKEECFTTQVAIDGSYCPLSSHNNGLVLLTPIDSRVFSPHPFPQRQHKLVTVGGLGHGSRRVFMDGLISRGELKFYHGSLGIRSYKAMADILCDSKAVFCHPMTGSGGHHHVKGRVIETGFAGACLFEYRGSPTKRWFTPGQDYVEYGSVDDVINRMHSLDLRPIAERFHKKVTAEHHPAVFWNKVLEKAGVNQCTPYS